MLGAKARPESPRSDASPGRTGLNCGGFFLPPYPQQAVGYQVSAWESPLRQSGSPQLAVGPLIRERIPHISTLSIPKSQPNMIPQSRDVRPDKNRPVGGRLDNPPGFHGPDVATRPVSLLTFGLL